eukprot:TRINITY_DN3595_c1_g1_i1.p1 TRINITY_DN3595_c1_g1~~TRINITY_DN3595_c1_g1_i1.p1  ORF type:complete len:676 (+),score=332.47 TRINITY_DN3595_c1_g1_i1:144-2030(+)
MPVPSGFRCPIKVMCDPVEVGTPGGLRRQDSCASRDRHVNFDEEHIEVATYDPSTKTTPEEKEALKRQEREAAQKVAAIEKLQLGTAAVAGDEKVARHDVEKEEHKRRKGLKGAYINSKTEIEIHQEQMAIQHLVDVQTSEDLVRLEVGEAEVSSRRDMHALADASRADAARREADRLKQNAEAKPASPPREGKGKSKKAKAARPPVFASPADIFSGMGWVYDEAKEETVLSPQGTKKGIAIDEVDDETSESQSESHAPDAVPHTQQQQQQQQDHEPAAPTPPAEGTAAPASQEDLEQAAEQIRMLTSIASTLRESNRDLRDQLEKLHKEHQTQAGDMQVLEERRGNLETRLSALSDEKEARDKRDTESKRKNEATAAAAASNDNYKAKYDRLHEQLSRGYEAMKALEEKNEVLRKQHDDDTKIKRLFEAHDRKVYERAVKVIGGKINEPFESSSEAKLQKKYTELQRSHKEAVESLKKSQAAEKAAVEEAQKLRKHAEKPSPKSEALGQKNTTQVHDELAKALREKADLQRLATAFQARLKAAEGNAPVSPATAPSASPAVGKDCGKLEKKLEEVKRQLELHQDKLRRQKEEKERLEDSLKKEKEKTKELRAVVAAHQSGTGSKKSR